MFGMAGGSAGQFVVGPIIASGTPWNGFWTVMGVAGLVIAALLLFLLPSRTASAADADKPSVGRSLAIVFSNPQSILCGVIAGLLFIPTTIFDMVWGVRFLEEARGLDYATAVMRSAPFPLAGSSGVRCSA